MKKKIIFSYPTLLLSALLIQQLLSYPAYSITIDYDGTDTSLLRVDTRNSSSTIPDSLYPGSNNFNGNTVNILGGTLDYVYGGGSSNINALVMDTGDGTQDVTGNTVNVSGGNVGGVLGGVTRTGNANDNTLNI